MLQSCELKVCVGSQQSFLSGQLMEIPKAFCNLQLEILSPIICSNLYLKALYNFDLLSVIVKS